ncbi:MAG: LysR substrate-binding domain-containing protein [Pseudomonadota bacterium]
MSRYRSLLPPPGSLIAFEAVASRLSFTQAAGDLGISQAATSRQIKILEDFLGRQVFSRERRQIRLTEAGEQLYGAVAMGLGHIASAVETLRAPQGGRQLSVATSVAFSTFWLMPRLARFHTAHPALQLRLMTSDSQADWLAPEVQVAVIYGRGAAPGARSERLFGEEVIAVGHPDLIAGGQPPRTAADLLAYPLLHLDAVYPSWFSWRGWFERCGAVQPRTLPGPRFNSYAIAIQAVREKRGITLGWRRLLEAELARGELVQLTQDRVIPEEAYYLVTPERWANDHGVGGFRDWIMAESRQSALALGKGNSIPEDQARFGPQVGSEG